MRRLIITLKSLAQLFQIPSESSRGCYIALGVNVNIYRLILKNCLYSTESDSVCRNQTNLRRNTPLRKRPTGLESACAPADIVPLTDTEKKAGTAENTRKKARELSIQNLV